MQTTLSLYECKHCSATGTCNSGKNQTACRACAKLNELPIWRHFGQIGLVCGCCHGLGKAEPFTDRLNKRMAPVLAVILAFGSAIIGAVTGFYFSTNKNNF